MFGLLQQSGPLQKSGWRGAGRCVGSGSAFLVVPKRELRKGKAPVKPKLRLKQKTTGEIEYPTAIPGFNPDQVEAYTRWLKKQVEDTKIQLGTGMGDRFKQILNREIEGRFESHWGIIKAAIKERAKKKRALKRKARRDKLFMLRIDEWNRLEDSKEDKILRDKERLVREERRDRFSFPKFLREDRERKKKPLLLETEQEFRQRVHDTLQNFLFKTPKSIRRVYHPRNVIGHRKRLEREVVDPWLIEIRRRAKVAELTEEREDAIAQAKWLATVEERRKKRLEEKHALVVKEQEKWENTMGQWFQQDNQYAILKLKYWERREKIIAKARREFLDALDTTVDMWSETPNECRFTRFRFLPDVQFPYNKSQYI
eukprot:TRINITY_DN1681_c0_g1_i1.p1 TRINITY_DN1681_c0_g1~~TRINITY_DN1681_c0_g1_i1.p1  ORF type:complete len:371 (-),score=92.26 TRINITY_DN1681_c0_g1_i1:73-1185(-)